MEFDEFKKILETEVDHPLDADIVRGLLDMTETVTYDTGDVIVEAGQMNTHVYFLKEGIIRYADMNGDKERTFAFGTPGTMFMSMHSFTMHQPSYYQIEACCPTVLLRLTYAQYWDYMTTHHEAALWMLRLAHRQLSYFEYINAAIKNGTARERFEALATKRPEIMQNVQQKVIASYLDITPEYLSRLKAESKKIR